MWTPDGKMVDLNDLLTPYDQTHNHVHGATAISQSGSEILSRFAALLLQSVATSISGKIVASRVGKPLGGVRWGSRARRPTAPPYRSETRTNAQGLYQFLVIPECMP